MTTKEAFELLTGERNWYKGLGFERVTASSYVSRFKEGKLSTEKIEEILEKAGFNPIIEKRWTRSVKRKVLNGPIYYIKDGKFFNAITDEELSEEELHPDED